VASLVVLVAWASIALARLAASLETVGGRVSVRGWELILEAFSDA
jgi:hypothetical protein